MTQKSGKNGVYIGKKKMDGRKDFSLRLKKSIVVPEGVRGELQYGVQLCTA